MYRRREEGWEEEGEGTDLLASGSWLICMQFYVYLYAPLHLHNVT